MTFFPKITSQFKFAIILDSPHHEELQTGKPLVHYAGRQLGHWLSINTIAIDQCFVGYTQYNYQDNTAALKLSLEQFTPDCILACGPEATKEFTPEAIRDLESYRGSLYQWKGFPVVITYSPDFILKQPSVMPFIKRDIQLAKSVAQKDPYLYDKRLITIRPTFSEVCTLLQKVHSEKLLTAFDVEGYNDNVGVTMYSIALSPQEVLVIPFYIDGKHFWSLEEEMEIWKLTAQWLSGGAPKIVTNAMYEIGILGWKHQIALNNVQEDTMFKQWEISPELPKSLASQVSFWTRQNYYKSDRLSEDVDVKLRYNGLDSLMSYECHLAQGKVLEKFPKSLEHYRFNISLIPAIGYIQLRGCNFDRECARKHATKAEAQLERLQPLLDNELVSAAVAAGVCTRARKKDPYHFNVKSVKQKAWLLYDYWKFKPYAKQGRTTSEEVLLRYYAAHRKPLLRTLIQAINIRTRLSDIDKLLCDGDGRIRANFNLVGTDTGRISSSASNFMIETPEGWQNTGTNLQNVTKELRDCFVPDNATKFFFECDLSGADGWTVAADLAALGYPAMLEDYQNKIKPAKVLLLMLSEVEAKRDPNVINKLSLNELRERTEALQFSKEVDALGRQGDWKYLCMKRVQHGSNYGMQPALLSATIFKDSEGTIDLTVAEATLYQWLYKLRYNYEARNQWLTQTLAQKRELTTACGIRRTFYDLRSSIKPEPTALRSALSFEPQANTTYVTNLALQKLWQNPQNRTPDGALIVEPLLLVHDAIAGQFPKEQVETSIQMLKQAFQHTIKIHGISVTIPFEGGYGTSWRDKSTTF